MSISLRASIKNILIKIGQCAKIDVMYLAKGNFWLGLDTVTGSLISLAIAIAFGNLVNPQVYGTYQFVLSFYAILTLTGLGGFTVATIRAIARGHEGELLKTFKLQFIGALFGGLASFGIAAYYFINHNNLLGFGFLILGMALPFIESLAIYEALLNGRKEFKDLAKFTIISQVFAAGFILFGIYLKFEVLGLLIIYFGSWTAARLFFFIYTIKKYKPNQILEDGTTKLGTHLSLMGPLNQIASYLDKIVLFHALGAAEVAVYSFAIAPTEQAKGLFKNISTLALPRFSERTEHDLKKTMVRKMLIMGLIVGFCILTYIIAAPLLFKLVLHKYTAAVFPSQIFVISLIGVIANLPISAMKSLSKIKSLYFYNISSPIINIVLILVLTPFYGLMGTILARLIGRISGIFIAMFSLYFID